MLGCLQFAILRTTDLELDDEYRNHGKVIRGLYHASMENRAVLVKQYMRSDQANCKVRPLYK